MGLKERIIKSLYKHDPHGKGNIGKVFAACIVVIATIFIVAAVKYIMNM